MDPRRDRPSVFGRPLLVAIVIMAACGMIYDEALRAGFIWDDDDYLTANPLIAASDGLKRIWFEPRSLPQYYPLVHTTFWIEHALWGFEPRGYHVVNVVLHVLAALLFHRVLTVLGTPGAGVAAVLFAVHPVHVESVMWVTERKNLLSLVFYLLSFLALLKYRDEVSRPRRWYATALICFIAALLSKTVACSLPAAYLLVLYWKKGRIDRRDVIAMLPFFAVGLAFALHTAWLERVHVRAEGADWDWSIVERFSLAARALCFYAGKLVWPRPLSFMYAQWPLGLNHGANVAALAAVVLVVGLASGFRRHIGRGPLTALLFFGGTLVPALGFFNVYPMRFSYVADHFVYHASLGLLALFGACIALVNMRLSTTRARGIFAMLVCAIIIAFGVTANRHAVVFRDLETLWRDTTRKTPSCWMAWNNLGRALILGDKVDEAEVALREAVRRRDPYPEAENNLGMVYFLKGDLDAARRFHEKALKTRPDDAAALNNLGNVDLKAGRFAASLVYYERALAADPEHTNAYFNLGTALAALERHEQALAAFAETLKRSPDDGPAHYRSARSLRALGRPAQALAHDEAAARRYPEHAETQFGYGLTLAALGRIDDAGIAFAKVLRLVPGHETARENIMHLAERVRSVAGLEAAHRFLDRVLKDDAEVLGRLKSSLVAPR